MSPTIAILGSTLKMPGERQDHAGVLFRTVSRIIADDEFQSGGEPSASIWRRALASESLVATPSRDPIAASASASRSVCRSGQRF